jgi:hypothetical protein
MPNPIVSNYTESEFEDIPQAIAESVKAKVLVYGSAAWARILRAAERTAVAQLSPFNIGRNDPS